MDKYSTDYLVSGAIFAAVVTAILVVAFCFAGAHVGAAAANTFVQVGAAATASALLVLLRPLLLKTLFSDRRSPFLLIEDLNAMILGRALGLACGILFGVTLFLELS